MEPNSGPPDEPKRFMYSLLNFLQHYKCEQQENIELSLQLLAQAFEIDIASIPSVEPTSNLPSLFFLGELQQNTLLQIPDTRTHFLSFTDQLKERGFYQHPLRSIEHGAQHAMATFSYLQTQQRQQFQQLQQEIQQLRARLESSPPAESDEARHARADQRKIRGNECIQQKNYEEAARAYGEAIDIYPNDAVYHANRAAAYTHLERYEDAIADCQAALGINPTYTKAFSRLGFAYLQLGRFEEAVLQYQRAADLEPQNTAFADALRVAKTRLENSRRAAQQPAGQQMPDLGALLNNPMVGQMMQNIFQGFAGPTAAQPAAGNASPAPASAAPAFSPEAAPATPAEPATPAASPEAPASGAASGTEGQLPPQLASLADDAPPELEEMMRSGNLQGMMGHPYVQQMMANPQLLQFGTQMAAQLLQGQGQDQGQGQQGQGQGQGQQGQGQAGMPGQQACRIM